MHEVPYEEGKELAQNNTCGAVVDGEPCGAELLLCWGGSWEIDGFVLRCAANEEHQGMIQRTSLTQEHRRGNLAPFPISHYIERKMLPREDLQRAMNRLAVRYPNAIVDPPTAALFLMDCLRLDIDPLITPAEAVPVVFKGAVVMIITEDGWLSMAARGCPERWAGAPRAEPVTDPALAESLCGDAEAWLWKASGRTRGMPADSSEPMAYGWFTRADRKKAQDNRTPAGTQPGNQARIRAIKRWVRENFPDCRQRMIDYTRDLIARSPETDIVEEFVDAEYSVIIKTEIGQDRKKESVAERKLDESAEPNQQAYDPGQEKEAGTAHFREAETAEKKKRVATAISIESVPAAEGPGGTAAGIDTQWLTETLDALHWTQNTTISFVVTRYKVSSQGHLPDVLSRLTRQQADDFVGELQRRLTKQQHLL